MNEPDQLQTSKARHGYSSSRVPLKHLSLMGREPAARVRRLQGLRVLRVLRVSIPTYL
jgi:hypothetical protein